MELRQLRSLRAIVATGSFGTAAEQLKLTQSALSHQIKQLEDELGATLLVRARPQVYLTDAGQVVLASADRILLELDELRTQFGVGHEGERMEAIRVAATTAGFAYLYGQLCQAFIGRYKGVKLDFTATDTPDSAVSKVAMRAVDVAFTPLPIDMPTLETVPLGEVEHVFIVSPEHQLGKARTPPMREVKRFQFVRFHRGSGSRMVSDNLFAQHGGYPPILTELNDAGFVKRIVAIGLAVALVPVFTVADELRSGALHAFRLQGRKITDQFGLVIHRRRSLRIARRFIDVCLQSRGPKPRQLTLETFRAEPLWLPHTPPASAATQAKETR